MLELHMTSEPFSPILLNILSQLCEQVKLKIIPLSEQNIKSSIVVTTIKLFMIR